MAGLSTPAVAAEFVTQQQAAAALQVTVNTIRSLIDRGELPAYRVGGRIVRIRRVDLDRILTPIGGAS
jgi:excisionase family DNA binding protein